MKIGKRILLLFIMILMNQSGQAAYEDPTHKTNINKIDPLFNENIETILVGSRLLIIKELLRYKVLKQDKGLITLRVVTVREQKHLVLKQSEQMILKVKGAQPEQKHLG